MKNKILICITFFSSLAFSAIPEQYESIDCFAAREYITTVQYLRSQKDFGLNNKEILRYADEVSKGCTGSSQRFIKVAKVLTKMGIDTRSSLNSAIPFADKDDGYTDAFVEIYKLSYDPKYLDLDALNSMKLSVELASRYEGEIKVSVEDFKKLVDYCLTPGKMDLPKAQCASIAQEITQLGQNFNVPMAEVFIKTMSFMQTGDDEGPGLDRSNALKITKEILGFGPKAGENFENAFSFAVAKSGLGWSGKQAIAFAKRLAKRSLKQETQNLKPPKK